jgi:plasmid stability protein
MKVTIDLDADIYRAVKVEAARTDRSVRDVVDEALAAWLEAVEDA